MKKIVFVFFIYFTMMLCLSCKKEQIKELKIAYSSDISCIVIKKIEKELSMSIDNNLYRGLDLGDCCGSYSQFAFANNQVDIAILCPDAVESLKTLGKEYISLGKVLYDSDVLVTNKLISDIKKVGYMNKRHEQEIALKKYFSSEIELINMFPSALGYALESDVVDAIFVDCLTYLKLNKEGYVITKDMPTQEMVIRKDLLNDIRVNKFIKKYNESISELQNNKDLLIKLISDEIKIDYIEELNKKWNKIQVQFAYLEENS